MSAARRTAAVLALGAAALLALVLAPRAPREGPRTPSDGAEVLEKVSPREQALGPAATVEEAISQARALIVEARRAGGDPRLLGRAQIILAPWWNEPDAPAQVLVLRATLRQSTHDFEGALADLHQVLAANPQEAQALLTRATVLSVLARYDAARVDCQALSALSAEPAIVCMAQLDLLTGQAARARAALERLLAAAREGATKAWVGSVLGDACAVLGDVAAAEASYRAALGEDPTDGYTRGALADLLLELDRPADAAAALEGHVDNDGQLLRLALAAKGARRDDAAWLEGRLKARVEEARRRGDVVHRREEARYALALEADAPRALALAKANFEVQREPWDVRLLLEAARAAGQPAAAAPALAWMAQTGFEEPRLRALAKELGP